MMFNKWVITVLVISSLCSNMLADTTGAKNVSKIKTAKKLKSKVRISDSRLVEPPQDLIDENGNIELDLIDPFQRGSVISGDDDEGAVAGFSSTSIGDLPDGIKVMAIVVPEKEEKKPMALIMLPENEKPYLVREGDFVKIKKEETSKKPSRSRRRNRKTKTQDTGLSALKAMKAFDFYLYIKKIYPTHIEAYQKKSPNKVIYLKW